VAAVPRGYKVRTVTHPSGHRVRVAFPPGRRSTGSGKLVSILHPKGENPDKCEARQNVPLELWLGPTNKANPKKTKTREQVEAMQTKAVNFLRDVVGDSDKADEIEGLSVAEYAERKKITLANAGTRGRGLGAGKKETKPRRGESWPDYHKRKVEETLAAMPKAIRDVFNRNPLGAKDRDLIRKAAKVLKEQGYDAFLDVIRRSKAAHEEKLKTQKGSNPTQAEDLFKTFHGKTPKETLELHESAAMRGEYTSLGELIELVVESPGGEDLRLGFAGEKVKLASSPAGSQLYLIGGNQTLDGSLKRFGADTSKDFVELGLAQNVLYRASKDFTDFKTTDFEHEFGEDSGDRPHVFYDKFKQRIFLMGGRYRIERPGIID